MQSTPGPGPADGTDPVESGEPGESVESGEPAAATPVSGTRSRRRWLLVTGAVLGTLVLLTGCAAGAAALVNHRWASVQRQEYALGHADYLRADCDQAIRHFRRAVEHRQHTRTSARANQERQECQDLVTARNAGSSAEPGKAAGALLNYVITSGRADSPPEHLRDNARDSLVEILARTPAKKIEASDVCLWATELQEQIGKSATRNPWFPELVVACAQNREKQDLELVAEDLYRLVIDDYPDTAAGKVALRRTILMKFQEIKGYEYRERFDQPRRIGSRSPRDGKVTLILGNDTRRTLMVMLTGPDTLTRTIRKCPKCRSFPNLQASSCAASSPSMSVTLTPGRYKMVAGDPGDPYAYGDWVLRAGGTYDAGCMVSLDN